MERVPVIVAIGPMRTITFSQWVSLNQCKLKAALRSAVIMGSLPDPLPTQSSLIGRFHHRAMELAAKCPSLDELRGALDGEIADLQSIVSSSALLRRMGSVSGWDEVNRSVVLAQERSATGRGMGVRVSSAAETNLRSLSGLLEGRPDFFTVAGSLGRLREYKAGRIRDDDGELLSQYRFQALFYSSLIFDNVGVDFIHAIVESLSGDRWEIDINREQARQFAAGVESALDKFNEGLIDSANPEVLAKPTKEGCISCVGRVACQSFKRAQDGLELTGDQYVVHGNIRGLGDEKGAAPSVGA